MKMKKYIIFAAAFVCALASCGRTVTTNVHDADKVGFDAWVHVQKEKHPEYLWRQTALGSWILEETVGTGELMDTGIDSMYARVNFTYRNTSGTITSTNLESMAKQLGTYSESYYYGPYVWYADGIYSGIEEILDGMRDGGRRKAAVPGWLLTYTRYDSPEKYLNDSTSLAPVVIDVELVDHFINAETWELDSISRYLVRNFTEKFGTDPAKAKADSSGAHGFYYISGEVPAGSKTISDSTVYINYTGRLLNGKVFDTSIRDTAIFHGVFNSSRTYGPVVIHFGDKWSDITMGTSKTKIVDGFARTLSVMKEFEKGTGIFYSQLGYKYSGSGSSVPGYSPLRFDIEIVENNED